MFAEDGRYEVPVRVTREKDAEWDLSPRSKIFDDTKKTLHERIKAVEHRLYPDTIKRFVEAT